MEHGEILIKLTEIDQREKSNTKRLDKLEDLTQAIHTQNSHIYTLINELKHLSCSIQDHDNRLKELECQDKKTMSLWKASIISAISSVLAGLVIGAIVYVIQIKGSV